MLCYFIHYIRSTCLTTPSGTLLQVNNTMISVFQRKRPRGDWMNVKMTGMVGESPVGFVKGACMCGLSSPLGVGCWCTCPELWHDEAVCAKT
jgi:hypothetical protein